MDGNFQNNDNFQNNNTTQTQESVNEGSNYYQDNTQVPPVNPQPVYTQPVQLQPQKQTNVLAGVGLGLGIASILFCCCYGVVGLIFGIAGIICSALSKKKGKSGVGTAGLVCSIIGTVLSVLVLIIFVVAFSTLDWTEVINEYESGMY